MENKRKLQIILNVVITLSVVGILWARLSGNNVYNPGGSTNISARDFGDRWPFQPDTVILACHSADTVTLVHPETRKVYALSQTAINFGGGWGAYQTLLRPGTPDELLPELLRRGLKLCPPRRD
ncbi:DUF2511 domain-containing protein [Deinococcus marmoris]|uniref:DUF2511 domain-containing protein n=1 Tax=Deinococcus marmoris TaxID=249408 RepID=UPI000B053C70|nr:DUF2511 domain-containing protein [Deinococcus marmoris]